MIVFTEQVLQGVFFRSLTDIYKQFSVKFVLSVEIAA